MFLEEVSPVIDVLVAGVFHQGSVNSVNSGLQLMLRHSPSVAQHLRGGISEGTQEEGNTSSGDESTNAWHQMQLH